MCIPPKHGHPMTSATYHWPNGKRIAVAITVMLETWSEGKAPPYGVQASPIKAGAVDLGGIAWGSYGGKIGVWRIINLLKQNGIRGCGGKNRMPRRNGILLRSMSSAP